MNSKRAIVIVGEPGVGKSTLVKRLVTGLIKTHSGSKFKTEDKAPVEGYRFVLKDNPTVWIFGVYSDDKAPFFGCDKLSMAVQPFALGLAQLVRNTEEDSVLILEGDRLGNARFIEGLHKVGFTVTLIVMQADPVVVASRRELRAQILGKPQSASFVKGRLTKIKNILLLTKGLCQQKLLAVNTDEELEAAFNYVSGFTAPPFTLSQSGKIALSSAKP